MNEGFDPDAAKQEILAQIDEFKKLAELKKNEDVKQLFDYQFKVAAQKMVYCFTGDNVKDWNDFCKIRGEIIARMEPIQTIFTAEAASQQLQEQLKTMFAEEY